MRLIVALCIRDHVGHPAGIPVNFLGASTAARSSSKAPSQARLDLLIRIGGIASFRTGYALRLRPSLGLCYPAGFRILAIAMIPLLLLASLVLAVPASGQFASVRSVGTEFRSDDLPDITAAADGSLWLVWMSHSGRRDEISLRQFRDGKWSNVLLVPDGSGDVWLPQVAVDTENRPWAVWSARRDGNWDLFARSYDP